MLVSRLPRSWDLIAIYRPRAAIAALFRAWKSSGRRREASQVRDLAHQEHLVAGLALATLITLVLGVQAADAERRCPARCHRRQSRSGRQSVVTLGREAFWQRRWRRDRTPIRWDRTESRWAQLVGQAACPARPSGRRRGATGGLAASPLECAKPSEGSYVLSALKLLVGEGCWGDERQTRTGMQKIAHRSQELYP
ncbi:MAG: hypothetical protein J7455_18970 [Roseiflexus sp.]|nr:hypothetical protein [Roseiflexus sp.]